MEYAGKDSKSHMLKRTLQSGYSSVSQNVFRMLQIGYNKNKVKKRYRKLYLTPTFVEHT